MAAIVLIAILILLVLALTIGFVPFLVGSLYVGGCLLVVVIVVVLLVMLVQTTFRSVAGFFSFLSPSTQRQSEIERRQALGYDTRELPVKPTERRSPARSSTVEAERRRQLGYTDESNEA